MFKLDQAMLGRSRVDEGKPDNKGGPKRNTGKKRYGAGWSLALFWLQMIYSTPSGSWVSLKLHRSLCHKIMNQKCIILPGSSISDHSMHKCPIYKGRGLTFLGQLIHYIHNYQCRYVSFTRPGLSPAYRSPLSRFKWFTHR